MRRLIEIRKEQPALSRRRFFKDVTHGEDVDEIYWLAPNGRHMSADDWNDAKQRSLGLLLLGHCSQIDDQGACIVGDNLLIMLNSGDEAVRFYMPPEVKKFCTLDRLFDTYLGETEIVNYDTSQPYTLRPRSMALLRHQVIKKS